MEGKSIDETASKRTDSGLTIEVDDFGMDAKVSSTISHAVSTGARVFVVVPLMIYAFIHSRRCKQCMEQEGPVMLSASCVHTRILWPTSNVEKDVIGESLMLPLVAMTFNKLPANSV